MKELEPFTSQPEEPVGINSFINDAPKTPVLNDKTVSNVAAKVAFLDESNSAEETYKTVVTELGENNRVTMDSVVDSLKSKSKEATQEYITEALKDPSISPAEKEELATKWVDNIDKEISVNRLMVDKAVVEDSSPYETAEEEDIRIDIAGTLKDADEYRSLLQNKINETQLSGNTKSLNQIGDMLEMIVPFVEQGLISNISSKLKSDSADEVAEGFVLLGKNKAKLRDWFASMPLDKRKEIIPKVIEVVQSSDTIVFNDTNDMLRMDFLRSIMEDGYYTDGDELLDNIVGVLDVVGLGFTVRGFTKAVKTSKIAKSVDKPVEAETKAPIYQDGINKHIEQTGIGKKLDITVKEVVEDVPDFKPHEKPIWKKGIEEHINKSSVRTNVQPSSVSQIIKDANPQKSRALHAAVATDETGEIAKAVYGTTRTEALANDLLPEISNTAGIITSKTSDVDGIMIGLDIINTKTSELSDVKKYTRAEQGALQYTTKEKVAARANVVNDFENVSNMTSRKEMFSWGKKADGASIKAVYGPTDGGFSNALTAKELAEVSLREYGLDDNNITILTRKGGNYIPVNDTVKLEDMPKGDYLVQVDYDYKFNPSDINFEDDVFDVRHNLFDYIAPLHTSESGSIMSHVLDTHSMISKGITRGASTAVDKSAKLTKMLGDETKRLEASFKKLSKERKTLLTNLWKEANAKGFDINDTVATARGLTPNEKAISDMWRETWDTIWFLENQDLKKTMQAQGFKVFTGRGDDLLFVKPQPFRNKGARVYDPVTDEIKELSKEKLQKIYDSGGEVGKLRTAIDIGGDVATKVISYNNPEGFIRGFTEGDAVLNYRKGYYHVQYTDPHFIERPVNLPNGQVKYVAVGTAKNKTQADLMVKRLDEKSAGKVKHSSRLDRNQTTHFGDSAWESIVASGRSAQKVRGKRLEDGLGNTQFETSHIVDPSEALANSIGSLSRRVEMREWLDATKARFMHEFGEVLPKDDYGKPVYPSKAMDIGQHNSKGGVDSKTLKDKAADAFTSYEYIRSMENGYGNAIDDTLKAAFNSIADFIGGRENIILDGSETFLRNRAKGRGLSSFGRKKAFQLYLALNPLRQIIVQSHQMVQIGILDPIYFTGRLVSDATALTSIVHHFNGKSNKFIDRKFQASLDRLKITPSEVMEMYNDWEKSGLSYAVDTHNLVRSSWEYATRGDFMTKMGDKVDNMIQPVQKIGFDAGERANVMSAWLFYRNRARKQGLDLKDPEVAEQVSADARNFTYNMNKAGDMPYNQNAFALALQFMQVPHKAFTQVLFNRTLTRGERLRLGIGNIAVYGTPALWIVDKFFGDVMPDDEEARKVIRDGLESVLLNEMFSRMTGEEVEIDWSTLAPWDAHGMADAVHLMFTSPIEAVLQAPAVQMVTGGGRVKSLLQGAGQYFGVVRDYEDATTLGRVANDFAKLSSGYSNAFKAYYALKTNEALNSYGDKSVAVSNTEAILKAFGFRTLEEATSYKTSMDLSRGYKELDGDITQWYKDYKRHMAAEGKPHKYYKDIQAIFNEAYRVFPNNAMTNKLLHKQMMYDYADGDATFIKRVFEQWDWGDKGKLRDIVRNYQGEGWSNEKKMDFIQRLEDLDKLTDVGE